MVRAYLRYQFRGDFGVIASTDANVAVTGNSVETLNVYTGANEFLCQWNPRTGEASSKLSVADSIPDASSGRITRIQVHPLKRNVVAVGYSDGYVRLWDVSTKTIIVAFSGHKSGVSSLAFSEDGHLLVSGGWDTDIVVWDITNQSGLYRLRGHQNNVTALRFLYPKTFAEVAGQTSTEPSNYSSKRKKNNNNNVELWQIHNGGRFVEMSRSPSHLVSGSKDGTVKIWDLATQWCIQTIFEPSGEVWSIAINPTQDRLVIGATDHLLKFYNLNDPSTITDTAGIAEFLGSIARTSGRGRISDLLFVVNADTLLAEFHEFAETMPGLTSRQLANVEVDPTSLTTQIGTILTGTDTHVTSKQVGSLLLVVSPGSKSVEVYHAMNCEDTEKKFQKRLRRASKKVNMRKEKLKDIEAKMEEINKSMPSAGTKTLKTAFDVERAALAAKLSLLSEEMAENTATNGETSPRIIDEILYINSFFLSKKPSSIAYLQATRTVAITFMENSLQVFSLPLEKLIKPVKQGDEVSLEVVYTLGHSLGHSAPPVDIAISHCDTTIASFADKTIHLWDVETCRNTRHMQLKEKISCGFFVAGNSHLLVATVHGTLCIVDVVACAIVQTNIAAHTGVIRAVAEHPKKTGFATVSADKTVKFYQFYIDKKESEEAVRFKELAMYELPDEGLDVKFSSDGKLVAISLLDFTIQLFMADTMKLYLTLYGHKLPCSSIDYSSDCSIIASGSADKTIKIWGCDFGNIQKSWHAHEEAVTKVAFLKDTHYVVSAGKDCLVKLWDSDKKDLICQFSGHTKPVTCLVASRLDGDRIIAGGLDGSVRIWQRTDEQIYADEEKEKLLEAVMDKEAVRSDAPVNSEQAGDQRLVLTRATRKTVESIISTEQLMEAIEQAMAAHTELAQYQEAMSTWEATRPKKSDKLFAGLGHIAAPTPPELRPNFSGLSPQHYLFQCINNLSAVLTHEVVVALPFSFTDKLLRFISDILESMAAVKSLLISSRAEVLVRVALLAIHTHMQQYLVSSAHRDVLLKLHMHIRPLLMQEKERFEFNNSALQVLQARASENTCVSVTKVA